MVPPRLERTAMSWCRRGDAAEIATSGSARRAEGGSEQQRKESVGEGHRCGLAAVTLTPRPVTVNHLTRRPKRSWLEFRRAAAPRYP